MAPNICPSCCCDCYIPVPENQRYKWDVGKGDKLDPTPCVIGTGEWGGVDWDPVAYMAGQVGQPCVPEPSDPEIKAWSYPPDFSFWILKRTGDPGCSEVENQIGKCCMCGRCYKGFGAMYERIEYYTEGAIDPNFTTCFARPEQIESYQPLPAEEVEEWNRLGTGSAFLAFDGGAGFLCEVNGEPVDINTIVEPRCIGRAIDSQRIQELTEPFDYFEWHCLGSLDSEIDTKKEDERDKCSNSGFLKVQGAVGLVDGGLSANQTFSISYDPLTPQICKTVFNDQRTLTPDYRGVRQAQDLGICSSNDFTTYSRDADGYPDPTKPLNHIVRKGVVDPTEQGAQFCYGYICNG